MQEISTSKESNDDFSKYRMYLIEIAKRNLEKNEQNEKKINDLTVSIELIKSQLNDEKEESKSLAEKLIKVEKLTLELSIKASIVAFIVSIATVAASNDFFKDLFS